MDSSQAQSPRVLIVAEHASAKFGGEAILPLHYFRRLRARGIEAWLIVHERTRAELEPILKGDLDRVRWIRDTRVHKFLFALSKPFPHQVGYFTFRRMMRLYSQVLARRVARELIREHNIDVVHQPIPVSPKESSLLRNLGAPVIIGPMNGGMEYPPGFGKARPKWISAMMGVGRFFSRVTNQFLRGKVDANALLVANDRTRRALPPGCRGRVIELVENGVDLAMWTPANSKFNAKVTFAFSGRLVDWKGVDLLLRALQIVRKEMDVQLQIVGDGVEKPKLIALSQSLGLSDSVQFLGWQPQAEAAATLARADAFILPSLYECGGAVVLEAMALSLPVIATKWGGPADYLDDSCGILVEPRNPEQFVNALAEAMKKLAGDAALREALGRAGRAKAEAMYDWERKIDAILNVYRGVIQTRSSSRRG